ARYAQSKKDFISKMSIALKEASESEYWIELLKNEYLTEKETNSIIKNLIEIIKMLTKSIKTAKEKNKNNG
ncbi:MAG: four helix bundle protein, partial [Candidatus Cloacimonadota bacterium]|nr:four helix bundle protein [Candidatus Cloacimonadota bacterium]